MRRLAAIAVLSILAGFASPGPVEILGEPERFAPGLASTGFSEVRLTLSPDGKTALWFSRDRPGGAGGYDIWMSRLGPEGWSAAAAVPFNNAGRDFDPAFSADGRFVYFASDRPGGLGGDDIWRVALTADGFGRPAPLGAAVNSPADEWAPMLSPDGRTLLFSSNRPGGRGRQDLYTASRESQVFERAAPVPGLLNSAADEFDATFLEDGATIVFSRAPDLTADRVDLHVATPRGGLYGVGTPLPPGVNGEKDVYGPMLDWSRPHTLTFSAQRPDSQGMDLYRVRYRLR